MFTIYTTSDCLLNLAFDYVEDNCNDWQKVMQMSKIIFHGDNLFKGDCASDDLPEESQIVLKLSQCGAEFNYDVSDYIPSIKNAPERVLEHPDSVFLLDVDSETAKKITENFGVICHPFNELDCCELTRDGYDRRLKRDKDVQWKDILDPKRIAPSNSMILIDRNYFANVEYSTGELYAFSDLPKFLDAFLPKSLSCTYDILLVFDKKDYVDRRRKKSYDPYGCVRDDNRKVKFKGLTLEELKGRLQQIADSIDRPYDINIECLPVESHALYSKDDFTYNPHNDTHDRKIVTSYNIIETTFAIALSGTQGARANQKVSINLSHSKCLIDSYQTPPINDIEDARNVVARLLSQNNVTVYPTNRLIRPSLSLMTKVC